MTMRFQDPMIETPEGRLLVISRGLLKAVEKNTNYKCACKGKCTCGMASKGYKSDRGQGKKPKLPSPKGDQDKIKSEDATTEFLREHGIITKYEQEHSVDNVVPQFMEISGRTEIRATGYTTNQRIPFMSELDPPKPISEVAKMPSVAQTGYDIKASSLHMHLNDGGWTDNRAPVEESLAELRIMKAGGQFGIVEEIAGLVEEVYSRL